MRCPICNTPAVASTWFCQVCGHQLKSDEEIQQAVEQLDDGTDVLDHDTITHEATRPEALILGELSANFDESSEGIEIVEASISDSEGKASRYVVYAETTATKMVQPDAVPRRVRSSADQQLTPSERRIVELADGDRSVLDIRRDGNLDKNEMVVSLLALIERGVLSLEETPEPPLLDASLLHEVHETPLPRAPPPIRRGPDPLIAKKAATLREAAARERDIGNVEAAKRNATLAVALDPDHPQGPALLASIGGANTRPGPRNPAALELFEAAGHMEQRGDIDGAIAALERATTISKEATIYNRLGVILATRKRDFVRAQQMLEEATRLAPDDPTYVHNLGKVLAVVAQLEGGPAKRTRPSIWSKLLGRR